MWSWSVWAVTMVSQRQATFTKKPKQIVVNILFCLWPETTSRDFFQILISPLKNLVWNQGAMYMYGEFHVRSRVKYTYFVGFATLVLEFFLEFAPRSLSLTHTRIFKKNLKDQVRLRRFLQCFHVSTKLYIHCTPYHIDVGQTSKNNWVTKWLNPPRRRQYLVW